jgi:RNA polymerase sigma-70 factor (ECF subfamily)
MTVAEPGIVEQIERIYVERHSAFCRLATSVTGNVETARDAVQEGFAQAIRRHAQYRADGPLEAWLWRIVLRSALDHRRPARPLPLSDAADESMVVWTPELPYPERDPELDAALRGLPPRQRLVVFLRYFADLSHAEIAAFTQMQPGTVSATLHQAKQALAKRLTRLPAAETELQR